MTMPDRAERDSAVPPSASKHFVRDVRLDNLKGVLIALVIVGHAVEPFRTRFQWVASLYAFIYLFHIPMFAYASGVVAPRELDARAIRGIIERLVLPYVALNVAYRVFDYVVFSRPEFVVALLSPFWILWYLVSLVWWRVLLPFCAQTRYPLVLAVVFALASGLCRYENNFAFARTFAFFPFFVFGHYYHSHVRQILTGLKRGRWLGLASLAGAMGLVFVYLPASFEVHWLYGSWSFHTLKVPWYMGMAGRLTLMAVSGGVGILVMACVPPTRGLITRYGEHSLEVYILHAVPIKLCVVAGLYAWVKEWHQALSVMVGSLLLVPILASPAAHQLANKLMYPSLALRDALLGPRTEKPLAALRPSPAE